MSLVYNENEPFTGNPAFLHRINPNRAWKKHFSNKMYLSFMLKNGTMIERHQASKELELADRKLTYWARHHKFDHDQSLKDAEEVKGQWA